ncbi:hypothetical protein I3J09_06070 [Streptomyces clavuligerus]|uniref:IncA domain-containing protein n=1 Tax=Streptomyces clavuligerus TaxID=1901 RepID=B5GZ46_STRCL|nr:hypothetical protein [Streptomyces clavuligerus]ANW21821.1 hypothetical protein BB341_06045 [Streptomyces clavuligerus]AXU16452.1 hypothetical protein D1794_06265 [Streptomyces clavuligerus]EDY51592.1 hypothetical protein SSCG_04383 [Streptomyces clavuligerus]EFG09646.1 IncA domain-containing protein [Streptomyces clavuligerus]MBY6302250.1 hypothetical protein [Streptomyces clavuligerus]
MPPSPYPGAPGGPPPGWQPPASPSNGMAITALVLGAVAVCLFWAVGLGVVLGVLAVIFGGIGASRARTTGSGRGLAVSGLVLGAVGIVGSALFLWYVIQLGIEEDRRQRDERRDAGTHSLSAARGPAAPPVPPSARTPAD